METKIASRTKEIVVRGDGPTILIGDRLNPTGRKRLTTALAAGDMAVIRAEAIAQVEAGADILDVNAGASGVDEVAALPLAVQAVMDVVEVPLSLDSKSSAAIEAALRVYKGKPLINSVSAEEKSLAEILPLVKKYGAAVVGLTADDRGIPPGAEERLRLASKIIDRAAGLGIPKEDVIIDCLALSVAADSTAAAVTLEAIRLVKTRLGVNQTLGTSNISHGLPEREVLNNAFLTLAVAAGVTCPFVHVEKARQAVLAADLLLGRDNYALRYIKAYRRRQPSGGG
jgi:5-methyltetrahydrofolate--homocysteine methyltransferase